MEAKVDPKFASMKQELQSLVDKLSEMELERDEHQLVIETLTGLEGDRKCFRLVGGVLVERNVKQVLPALISNKDGILEVIKKLQESYKEKEREFLEYQKSKQ